MITLGRVSVDEVMGLAALGAARGYVLDAASKSWLVKVCDSQRIMVFFKSLRCVSCERVGVEFRLERHLPKDHPHLNLYSADSVLMTKDHIIPKSKGGKNYMSNYQTMCCECNEAKGSGEPRKPKLKLVATILRTPRRRTGMLRRQFISVLVGLGLTATIGRAEANERAGKAVKGKLKIKKLTDEQLARLPEIAKEWIGYGLSTETDRKRAESLVPAIYREGGLEPPGMVLWAESPKAGWKKCKELLGGATPLPCYGAHDAAWLAFYAAFLEFGVKECERLVPTMEMAKCSGWFFPMDEACILTPNPSFLSLDGESRLHHTERQAIEYPDGWGMRYLHGVRQEEHGSRGDQAA